MLSVFAPTDTNSLFFACSLIGLVDAVGGVVIRRYHYNGRDYCGTYAPKDPCTRSQSIKRADRLLKGKFCRPAIYKSACRFSVLPFSVLAVRSEANKTPEKLQDTAERTPKWKIRQRERKRSKTENRCCKTEHFARRLRAGSHHGRRYGRGRERRRRR